MIWLRAASGVFLLVGWAALLVWIAVERSGEQERQDRAWLRGVVRDVFGR